MEWLLNPEIWMALLTLTVLEIVLDIVFSLDSVITAIGLVNQLPVMVTAIVIAVVVMIFVSGSISRFIERHPTVKILALKGKRSSIAYNCYEPGLQTHGMGSNGP